MEGTPYKRAMLGRIGQSLTGLMTFPGIAYFQPAPWLDPLDQKPNSKGQCLLFDFIGGRTS